MQAKFDGPYEIESQLSETDYIVRTPDREGKLELSCEYVEAVS